MFILHVYYLTLMAGGGGEGGAVPGVKAAKPVTAVHVCASAFARVKPLAISKETLGHFQRCLW